MPVAFLGSCLERRRQALVLPGERSNIYLRRLWLACPNIRYAALFRGPAFQGKRALKQVG